MPISLLNLFESSGVTAVKDQLMFCPLQEKMTEKVAAKAKNLFVPIFWWKLHEIIWHRLKISFVYLFKE